MISRPLLVVTAAEWEIHELVLDKDKAPVSDFLDELPRDEVLGFVARFEKLLRGPKFESALPAFKSYRGLWQIGTHRHRILGFRWGDILILTNGFKKTRTKTPPEEVSRCEALKARYFSEHPPPGAAAGRS